MSMLAEPKRKQKWSLNPRGKDWAEDTNKYGQKLLEKMGWSKGKGLGVKENGVTEHVKVVYKNDSKGMGYKDNDNQWTEHETNFSALLEALGGNQATNEAKLSSLEEKSQNSRVRVHYKKFTRGKDLSRYSEKDLANIFGRKSLKKVLEEEYVKGDNDNKNKEHSSIFSNGGLMSDYFKKKFPNFAKSSERVVDALQKGNESESESEVRTSFGFGFKQSIGNACGKVRTGFVSYIDGSYEGPVQKKRKSEEGQESFYSELEKRKKIKNAVYEGNGEVEEGNVLQELEADSDQLAQSKRKKKKKKDKAKAASIHSNSEEFMEDVRCHTDASVKKKIKSTNTEECGVLNPAFDPIFPAEKIKKHLLEYIEENVAKEAAAIEEVVGDNNEHEMGSVKKATKRKKDYSGEVIQNLKLQKKKKYDFASIEGVSHENKPTNNQEESGFTSEPITGNCKIIKKKKKKKQGLENPTYQEVEDVVDPRDIRNNNFEIKPKKKKKLQENEPGGLDNPGLNLSDQLEDCSLILNVVSTPVLPKQQKNLVQETFLPNKVKRRKSVRFSDVTRQIIIPNKEEPNDSSKIFEIQGKLNDTPNYPSKFFARSLSNKQAKDLEENITSISEILDAFEAEVENDLNEAKMRSVELEDIMVGEVGNPEGLNEKLPDGSVKLKFKNANFTKRSDYFEAFTGSKKAYKHLIKGDIVLEFNDTNLHEVRGYALKEGK